MHPHHRGGPLLLGAIGALQFDVVMHRLEHEYGVQARISSSNIRIARWISAENPRDLKAFIERNAHRIAYDAVDAPTFVCEYPGELSVTQERSPEIAFHKMREHAGLIFHTELAAAA